MKKDFTIRFYRPGDEKEIVPLLVLGFHGWPHIDLACSPLEHWRWKYIDNPIKRNMIAVAESKDKIVGCLHEFLRTIKIGEDFHLCSISGDLAVHPDFRRMGIWSKMSEFLIRESDKFELKMTHFLSGNPIVIRRLSKRRPRFPHPVRNLVFIRDIDAHLKAMPIKNSWLTKSGFRVLKLANNWRNALRSLQARAKPKIDIYEIQKFDDEIDDFWKRISHNYHFIGARTKESLNWRYCDPRAGRFIVRQAEEDGQILGYSVLTINSYRSEYPVGFLVDLLVLQERPEAVEALIGDAVRYFEERDVNIINYLLVKNHPYEAFFRRNGFLDSRVKFHLLYWSDHLTDDMNKLVKHPASKIFFSWGDHDSLPLERPS